MKASDLVGPPPLQGHGDPPKEAPFEAPWQAQVFAMAVSLQRSGVLSWPRFTAALGEALAKDDDNGYFGAWLKALEQVLETGGAYEPAELHDLQAAWRAAFEATPHGQPVVLKGRATAAS